MPLKIEILQYLREISEFQEFKEFDQKNRDEIINGVNTDNNAVEGQLAWISIKNALKEPERLKSFSGSILIAPPDIDHRCLSSNRIVVCSNPKHAFIRVVDRFFHDLAYTEWPKVGENPILPTSQIGRMVKLSHGVVVGSNVILEDNVIVGPNTAIANCTVKRNTVIGANCSIGLPGFGYEKDELGKWWRFPHMGRIVIGENVEIGSNTCIDRGSIGDTVIKEGVKIDNLVHVAHNVIIGSNSLVIANSMLGGSAVIGDNAWVAPSVSIMNQITVGNQCVIGMGAVVLNSVDTGSVVVGNPARILRKIDSI